MAFPTMPFPTERPAIAAEVYLSLTICFSAFYSLIFLYAYVQLFFILYYKYKRLSYQTGLLFLSLIWSGLRISLFSFYFQNAEDANKLPFAPYFVLYCLPVVLQFCTLTLLVLYYGQVFFKVATRDRQQKNNFYLRIVILISIGMFLCSSVISAYLTRQVCILNAQLQKCDLYKITLVRVSINDILFVVYGFLLGYYIFKLANLSISYAIPEYYKISIFKAMVVIVCTSFMLISRTIYNLLAITIEDSRVPDFGFDWINVSDQADLVNLTETNKFITFVLVLLIWELIPAFVIITLFRVKAVNGTASFIRSDQHSSFSRKSVFIDSNKYDDSDDDDDDNSDALDSETGSHRSLSFSINTGQMYGSVSR
nr:G protein-coupled receptor [Proales similis]